MHFEITRVACILVKCLTTRLWEHSQFVSKLIPKIGPVLSKEFVLNGKTTFQSIRDTNPRDLERVSQLIFTCKSYKIIYKLKYIHLNFITHL